MLRLEHISWNTPEGTKVLDDLSLTAQDGKLTVITVPNGGGQTTLATLIARLRPGLSGRHGHYGPGRDTAGPTGRQLRLSAAGAV